MVILFRMCLSERRIVIDTNALKVINNTIFPPCVKADPDEDDTFLFVKSEFSVTYQAVEGKKFFVNSFTVKSFHAMIIFINDDFSEY